VPLLAPGGAGVHLRGIARGFIHHASVEAWVARTDPGSRGPAAPAPCSVRTFPRGHLPGALRKRRSWDAAADARIAVRTARRWHRARPVDLIYERAALYSRIGRLRGAARVVELNAPLAWEAAWFEGAEPGRALLAAEARSLGDADLVVVVSDALAEYARRRGVPAERIVVLPNGADVALVAPRSGPRVIGYAGTFKPWHGLESSIDALVGLDAERIELWGDGPERAAFVHAALAAGLRVDWRGWGTPSDLARAREGWTLAWVPRVAWPPPGSDRAAVAFDEPVPEPYYSPLKEAEAAAAGLAIWRGAGPPESMPRPAPWRDVAAAVLQELDARDVPCMQGSWFNEPAAEGHTGAA
jgi:glycosyltransferase involved in cell wall biosynthesis